MNANQINKLNLGFLIQMRVIVKVKEPEGIRVVRQVLASIERQWRPTPISPGQG
jgi:hypothetical protein